MLTAEYIATLGECVDCARGRGAGTLPIGTETLAALLAEVQRSRQDASLAAPAEPTAALPEQSYCPHCRVYLPGYWDTKRQAADARRELAKALSDRDHWHRLYYETSPQLIKAEATAQDRLVRIGDLEDDCQGLMEERNQARKNARQWHIDWYSAAGERDQWERAARKALVYLAHGTCASCPPDDGDNPQPLCDGTSAGREKCVACWQQWAGAPQAPAGPGSQEDR